MSLINQALRKAQRDRSPNRMAQPGEQSSAAYASTAARGMSPVLVIGLVIAVAVLIGLVVGLSIVIFKGDSQPQAIAHTTQSTVPRSAPTPAPTPTPAAAEPAPTSIVIPQASTHSSPQVSREATPMPSVVDELRKAREAAEAKAIAEAQAAEEEAQAAAEAQARADAKPSQDSIQWLGQAKITGVKLSDTASKVIINGEAYSVGDFVNYKLGLKVMVIQQERVLFIDNNGKKYMKRL
ncbi:hypothetical protein SH580_13670 [Coraliomargarita algicola]|uniref:Type II secretion system protein GspC N-terminal domain-containing protein n=1 Tax=Coraliomargarita algicola TaxID=3092156 RepID=A0ABZ0RGW8_9BACT|nr:hypothetical protein [Coraliomargarita sp. J2-16]WPJ94479.1 hypothetical protein SH580_13670 [Coraliomargarita sp. J2-16]